MGRTGRACLQPAVSQPSHLASETQRVIQSTFVALTETLNEYSGLPECIRSRLLRNAGNSLPVETFVTSDRTFDIRSALTKLRNRFLAPTLTSIFIITVFIYNIYIFHSYVVCLQTLSLAGIIHNHMLRWLVNTELGSMWKEEVLA